MITKKIGDLHHLDVEIICKDRQNKLTYGKKCYDCPFKIGYYCYKNYLKAKEIDNYPVTDEFEKLFSSIKDKEIEV